MPRPPLPSRERRQHHIGVRLRAEQHRRLLQRAEAAGLSVSAYLAQLIDQSRAITLAASSPPDIVPLSLLAQWQRVGNNVNQIARAMHRGRNVTADTIVGTLSELLALMLDDQLTRRHALRSGGRRILEL